jgi:hypothetical protein
VLLLIQLVRPIGVESRPGGPSGDRHGIGGSRRGWERSRQHAWRELPNPVARRAGRRDLQRADRVADRVMACALVARLARARSRERADVAARFWAGMLDSSAGGRPQNLGLSRRQARPDRRIQIQPRSMTMTACRDPGATAGSGSTSRRERARPTGPHRSLDRLRDGRRRSSRGFVARRGLDRVAGRLSARP